MTADQPPRAPLDSSTALARQMAEVDTLYATAPVGLGLVDCDLRWVRINQRLAAINGLPVEAHLGRTLRDVLGAPLADRVEPMYRQVIASGEPLLDVELSGSVATQPGVVCHWLVSYHPLRAADGTVLGVSVAVQDVTERRQAEEDRRRFAALVEQSDDSIGWAALDGQALYMNRAACALMGVPYPGGVRRLNIAEITAPEDVPMLATTVLPRVLGGGTWKGELRTRNLLTGEMIPMEQVVFPLVDAQTGAVDAIATIARDLRQPLEADRRARRSEAGFQSLFEASAVGNAEIDWPSGRFVRVNARFATLLGHDPAALRGGATLLDVMHAEERDRTTAAIDAFVAGAHGSFELDTRYVHTDGHVVWGHLVGTRLPDAGDQPRLLVSVVDVTDRQRAEDRLLEADRKKNEFLAVLAHELRNPLAPIRNGLQIMKLAADNPVAVERARTIMARQVEQMTRLIDDLMDVSRISQGRILVRKSRLALDEAIQNAVDSARPLIEAHGHRLVVEPAGEPIHVDGDLLRLSQVFTNILNNAAKYTPRGGEVRLRVRRDGDRALVTVTDTGIGIPAEKLAEVFEMFAQVDGGHDLSRGGLGLGLHIARRLIEKHGGRITVESTVSVGSRFTIELPALPRATTQAQATAASISAAPAGQRRVLVVDDNVDAAGTLASLLELMGHETRTAHGGAEAVALAESFRPHLILMDLGMPGVTGYEACRRIREAPWGAGMAIVAQTGWGQEADRRAALAAGFDSHLVKPVEPAALLRLLDEAAPPADRR